MELGKSTREEIIAAIRNGRSLIVEKQTNRVTVHDVTLADGKTVRVVYDKHRGELVTFLPTDVPVRRVRPQ